VWGITTNGNLGDLIEQAITGVTDLNVTSGNITLTALNGVVDQSRSAVLRVTGTPGTTRVLTIPNVNKTYTVKNTSDATVQVKTAAGTPFDIPSLSEAYIYCDGSNVVTGRVITDGAQTTLLSTQTPFNNVTLTGVPIAPTAAAGTNNTQIATTAFVNSALPVGSVIMWYGLLANIPTGWQICDGTNGTPDMRDRFPVGAGTSYALNDTGGANSVTLDVTQIPSHAHTGSSATESIAHTHDFSVTSGLSGAHDHTGTGTTSTVDLAHTHSGTTGNNNVGHDHGFSGTTGSVDLSHSHAVSDPGHGHIYQRRVSLGGGGGNDQDAGAFGDFATTNAFTGISIVAALGGHAHSFGGTTAGQSADHNHAFTTGAMSANATHSHTVSITTSTASNHQHAVSGTTGAATSTAHSHVITVNATGGGLSHENRPPYLAMFFIMRV
jgi:microcystin-dependent protein